MLLLCWRWRAQGDFGLSLFQDGLLQAAFMVGLLVSSPVFAEASKHFNAFRLIGAGLGVWTAAVRGAIGLCQGGGGRGRPPAGLWPPACACSIGPRTLLLLHSEAVVLAPSLHARAPPRRRPCCCSARAQVVGCGLSVGFLSLLLCRMAVGVGEASFVALASPFIGGWAAGQAGRAGGLRPLPYCSWHSIVGRPHAALLLMHAALRGLED